MALGMCPKRKLFKAYIELETQLGSIDRCRKCAHNSISALRHRLIVKPAGTMSCFVTKIS